MHQAEHRASLLEAVEDAFVALDEASRVDAHAPWMGLFCHADAERVASPTHRNAP